MTNKLSGIQIACRIVLGFLLVSMTTLGVLHQRTQRFFSVDALDPFGGLETLMKFLAGGKNIQ